MGRPKAISVKPEKLLKIQRDLGIALSSATDLYMALNIILDTAFKIDGLDCGGVYVVDRITGDIDLIVHKGLPPEFISSSVHYSNDSPQARLVSSGKPIYGLYPKISRSGEEACRSEGLRALAVIPVMNKQKISGVLNLASHTHDEISEDARHALESIASQIGGVLGRLQSEAALHEHQKNLKALFDTMLDFVFVLDTEGNIIHVNPQVEKRLGYTAAQLSSMHVLELHPEAERDNAAAIIKAMTEGTRSECPVPLVTKDGKMIPVETKVSVGRWDNRNVLFGFSRDITRRKEAEEQIQKAHAELEQRVEIRTRELARANEELQLEIDKHKQTAEALKTALIQQQAILDNIPDIAWLKDLEGRFISVNEAFGKACGLSPEKVAGKTDLDVWSAELARQYRTDDIEVVETGHRKIVEETIVDSSDQTVWVETIKTPILDKKGTIIGTTGIARDITSRKRTEEALRQSEEKFAKIFNSSPDAIVLSSIADGRIIEVNDSFTRLSGFGREEVLGLTTIDLNLWVDPDDRARYVSMMTENKRVKELEAKFRVKSGEVRDGLLSGEIVEIGAETCLLGTIRDITDARRLENEIFKIEKLESLGVLAGGIAHDFNNFLAGIIGNLSLAKLDSGPTDAIYPRLEEMEKAAMRAKDLTQQLLTFSRGGEPLTRPLDIKEIVKDSALFALRGSNVRCAFDFRSDSLISNADEGQLSQVIHNLILNAVQAMPEGGEVHIGGEYIELSRRNALSLRPGEYVRLTIRDQGIGIKKEHLKKIFDPYFTTKQKGSGIGLAVVFSIIEKHNGRITVDSDIGLGTTFSLYMPAAHDLELTPGKDRTHLKTGAGKILVMDDEEFIRQLVFEMLQKMGYTASLANRGEEAIELYQQAFQAGEAFDAVILDLTVPGGMGGKQTIRELLKIDPNVRAIVSSGYSNDPVMSNCGLYGFKKAVKKPYLIQELSEALRSVLPAPNNSEPV